MKLLLDEMYSGLREYFEVLGWNVIYRTRSRPPGRKRPHRGRIRLQKQFTPNNPRPKTRRTNEPQRRQIRAYLKRPDCQNS